MLLNNSYLLKLLQNLCGTQEIKLHDKFFLRLAVVAMAGLAAEGLQYDKVVGQSADLFTLQVTKIMRIS